MRITPLNTAQMPNPWANKPKLSVDLLQKKSPNSLQSAPPRQDDALFSVLEQLPTKMPPSRTVSDEEQAYLEQFYTFDKDQRISDKSELLLKIAQIRREDVARLGRVVTGGKASADDRIQLELAQKALAEINDPQSIPNRQLWNWTVRDIVVVGARDNIMYKPEYCGKGYADTTKKFVEQVNSSLNGWNNPGVDVATRVKELHDAYKKFDSIRPDIEKNFYATLYEKRHAKAPEEKAAQEAEAALLDDTRAKLERIEQRTTRSAAVLPQAGVTPWGRPAWAATPALYRGRFRARA